MLIALLLAVTAAQPSLPERVAAARKCKTSRFDETQLNCRYTFETVDLEIAGVGADDAQIAVNASSLKGTYYVSFMLAVQCAVVKAGEATPGIQHAWVSPKNGKVYADPTACRLAVKGGL